MRRTKLGTALVPLLAVLRIGLVVATVFFLLYDGSIPTVWPLLLYAVAAVSSGYILVTESSVCQVKCGFDGGHLCPIVAMMSWTTMQFGVVIGNSLGSSQGCMPSSN